MVRYIRKKRKAGKRARMKVDILTVILLVISIVLIVLLTLCSSGIKGINARDVEQNVFVGPVYDAEAAALERKVILPKHTEGTDPYNWGIKWDIIAGGSIVDSYKREEKISFGTADEYFPFVGISAFRGDNYRSGATYGTADVAEYYTKCAEYCDMIINDRNAYVKEYEEENKITSIGWKDDKYPLEHHPLTNSGNTGVLDNPYSQIFGTPNNLRESIFEIQHSSSEDNANYEVPAFYGYYGSMDFTLGPLSAPRYMAEKSNEGLYAQTDFRRVSFIEHEDGEADLYNIIKFNYISASGTIDKPDYKNAAILKSTGTKDNNTYIMTQTNWIVYRITDVMLMKAEALAFRNDTTNGSTKDLENAFALTKAVYDRSNPYIKASTDTLTYTHGSAASLQEVILEERQRELAFEGKRWFDLVRKALRDGNTGPMLDILINNKYESNQKAIRSKMTAMDCLFFPILERELHANPLLKQNPAYETEDLFEKN